MTLNEEEKKERKARWNKYQANYIKNNYKAVTAYLDKDLVDEFRSIVKSNNDVISDIIRNAINEYIIRHK